MQLFLEFLQFSWLSFFPILLVKGPHSATYRYFYYEHGILFNQFFDNFVEKTSFIRLIVLNNDQLDNCSSYSDGRSLNLWNEKADKTDSFVDVLLKEFSFFPSYHSYLKMSDRDIFIQLTLSWYVGFDFLF